MRGCFFFFFFFNEYATTTQPQPQRPEAPATRTTTTKAGCGWLGAGGTWLGVNKEPSFERRRQQWAGRRRCERGRRSASCRCRITVAPAWFYGRERTVACEVMVVGGCYGKPYAYVTVSQAGGGGAGADKRVEVRRRGGSEEVAARRRGDGSVMFTYVHSMSYAARRVTRVPRSRKTH